MKTIEQKILAALIYDETYVRKVLPFLKSEYFQDRSDKIVFETISEYINKYNSCPTPDAVEIAVSGRQGIDEDSFDSVKSILKELDRPEEKLDWLVDESEKFCRERAIYNALLKSIAIVDGKDKKQKAEAIPAILQDAIAVCFDNSVGHDYEDDAESRYDVMTQETFRLKFDIDKLNTITGGGLKPKTLSVIMAGCVHPDTKVRIRFRKK